METGPVLKKRRYAVPLALLAAAVLLLFSPYLLSSTPVLRFVTGTLAARLPGSLSVDSWLVSWHQGILWQQIVYTDPGQGIRLSIPQMTTTQGLLQLALAPTNLGRIILSSPQLEFKTVTPAVPAPTPGTGRKPAPLVPFWNHLAGDLEIRDGQVTVVLAEPELVTGLRDVSLSASLVGGIVTYALDLHALRDQGSARAEGTLNLPARGEGGLGTLVADGKFTANGLQLRDLLAIAEKRTRWPGGAGALSADLDFKGVSQQGLQVSGWAEVDEVRLRGGFLGADTPAWQRLRLDIDGGKWATTGWSARKFDLACDSGQTQGSVEYGGGGLQVTGKGRVNLPVLFAQFPRLLRLRETTRTETGALDFSVAVGRSGDARHLDLSLRADPLSGRAADGEFTWAGPISIQVNGEQTGADFRVNALQINTPFFKADGRGDHHSFVFDATADLRQAMTDLGRLFQLEWNGSGQLDLVVKGALANDAQQQRLKADADLQISGFALNHAGVPVVPPDDFSLLASLSAPLPLAGGASKPLDLQLTVSSWLGETFLVMNGEKADDSPFRGSYSTDTSLSLKSAGSLLHALKLLPGAATVAGDMQVQATGSFSATELEIRDFSGEIGRLILERDGTSFAEEQVRLEISQSINEEIKAFTAHNLVVAASREEFFRTGAGANVVNLAGHGLFLRNLHLASATGSFNLAELLLPDWRKPLTGLRADLSGTFDLARLSGLLRGAALLDGQVDLAGTGHLALHAAPVGPGEEMAGELRLADVGLLREKKRTPVSRELSLGVRMARQDPEGEIDIKELRLLSDPLQVEASGAVRRDDAWRKIELQGRITPALDQVSAVLRDGFGIDLRLAGGQSEPFLAQIALVAPDADSGAGSSLVTSLHADRLEYQGLALRSLHLPFSLENRGLHLEVTGQLDGEGRVVFIADTDLAASPATITMPANSQVLTGAQVQKPLVDNLLAFLHPMFGALARPTGRFDLRLDSFAWPLSENGGKAAEFAAVTDLRDLTLQGSEVLRQILIPFALEKETIALADSELACTARQGRVTCPPVRVRVGEAEMLVSGAVGLDGTLDALLEVPVTRKLVSEEGYRFLQGATVRVPVRGTVKAPVFDRVKTTAAVLDLLQQAAKSLLEEKAKERTGAGRTLPGPDRKG